MKKAIIAGLCVVGLLTGGAAVKAQPEAVKAVKVGTVSFDEYEGLKEGMTVKQVAAAVGGYGEIIGVNKDLSKMNVFIKYKGEGLRTDAAVKLWFINGKLSMKGQQYLMPVAKGEDR